MPSSVLLLLPEPANLSHPSGSGDSRVPIHGILTQITAPALRTLELRFHIPKAPPTIYLTCNKLRKLSNLSIEIVPHNDDTIIALLSRTTSLTALSLGPDNASLEVLEVIGSRLLLKLTILRLHLSTVRAQPGKVISMMELRRDSIHLAALEEVTFVRSGHYESRLLETVEALQGLGLYRWEGDKIFQR